MKITITIEDKALLDAKGKETGADVDIQTSEPIDPTNKKHKKSTAVKMLGVFLERLDSVMGADITNLETGGKPNGGKTKDTKHRRKM